MADQSCPIDPAQPVASFDPQEVPRSTPELRLAAYDPVTNQVHAATLTGDWVGTVNLSRDGTGTVVKLTLRPNPLAFGPEDQGQVLRSLEPIGPGSTSLPSPDKPEA